MRNLLIALASVMVIANLVEFSLARRIKREVNDKQNHTTIAKDFVVLKESPPYNKEPKETATENVTNNNKIRWYDAIMEKAPAVPIAYALANANNNNNAQGPPKPVIPKDPQNRYDDKSKISKEKPMLDKDITKIMDSQVMGPARFFSLYYNFPLAPLDQMMRLADSILYKVEPGDDDNMENDNIPVVELNSIESAMPRLLFRKPINTVAATSFYTNQAGQKETLPNLKPKMDMEPNDIFNLFDNIFQNPEDHQPPQGDVETFCPIHGVSINPNAKGSCGCHLLKDDSEKTYKQNI